jgi:hypothetical protein
MNTQIFRNKKIWLLILIGLIAVFVIIVLRGGRVSDVQEEKTPNLPPVISDLKPGQQYQESPKRTVLVEEIKSDFPISDPQNGIFVQYYPNSKAIVAWIDGDNLNLYKSRKKMAEEKLRALAGEQICDLIVFWAPSNELKHEASLQDRRTSGCNNY